MQLNLTQLDAIRMDYILPVLVRATGCTTCQREINM